MKKIAKAAIVAASVAAVVGIGAVSFAAWTGATGSYTSTSGVTGKIEGKSLTVTANNLDTDSTLTSCEKALFPLDQTGVDGAVTCWQISFTVAATGGATVTKVKVTQSNAGSPMTLSYLSDKDHTPIASDVEGGTTLSATYWTALVPGTPTEIPITDLNKDGDIYTIKFAFASNSASDMNKNIDLTLEAA